MKDVWGAVLPSAYTEEQLVEQPAIGLFAELGWATVSAMEESFGAAGTLGRETKGEVVLVSRLRAALARLNPALPPESLTAAFSRIWPVSPVGEMACFSEIPAHPTGHRSGHKMRQSFCKLATIRLLSIIKIDNKPDIHADI